MDIFTKHSSKKTLINLIVDRLFTLSKKKKKITIIVDDLKVYLFTTDKRLLKIMIIWNSE